MIPRTLKTLVRFVLNVFVETYAGFKTIWQKKLLRAALLVFLAAIFTLGGFGVAKALALPGIKTYPEVSFTEFLGHIKHDRVANIYPKLDSRELEAEEVTTKRLVIFLRLKSGEVQTTPEIASWQLNYTEFEELAKTRKVKGIAVAYTIEMATRSTAGGIKEITILGWQDKDQIFVVNVPPLLFDRENFSRLVSESNIQYWEVPLGSIGQSNWLAKWKFTLFFGLAWLPFMLFVVSTNAVIRYQEREKKKPRITFDDVAGVDEAKARIKEIQEFLKSPQVFLDYGARPPRGVLLVGPPGCGKTRLVQALATESGAIFEHVSGSEFGDKYIRSGARAVENLFNGVRQKVRIQNKTAIIFIDEIDAIGTRTASSSGGDTEFTQTIAQILHEMEGFTPNERIIVIGATNRPENLDPAIRRRFDEEIVVPLPDLLGREAILAVHCRNKKLHPDLAQNIAKIAALTPLGFSGNDLENVANEAALSAAKKRKPWIELADFAEAVAKVLAGPERKSAVVNDKDKERGSFHEMGHTLNAFYLFGILPPTVSIVPTTKGFGGFTLLPELQEKYYWTLNDFKNLLKVAYGGRASEELIFGPDNVSQGASDDLAKATQVADQMIFEYGMASDVLGPRTFGTSQGNQYLGTAMRAKNYSEETAKTIDAVIKKLLSECYKDARNILKDHRPQLEFLANALRAKEKLTREELQKLMEDEGFPK